tara:strand:+ start:309 stop:800 length:492 start_codon:yes stop_codon:yes gene_type:complete
MKTMKTIMHRLTLRFGWYEVITQGLPLNVCRSWNGDLFFEGVYEPQSQTAMLEALYAWGVRDGKDESLMLRGNEPVVRMGNGDLPDEDPAWRDWPDPEEIPRGYYFWAEDWANCSGPFKTKEEAEEALFQYDAVRSGPTPEEEAEAAEIIYESQLDQVREYNQ